MSFRQYSKLDQLRNEYHWWLEQRMETIREHDLEYRAVCDDNLSKLWADIKVEFEYVKKVEEQQTPKKWYQRLLDWE